MDHKQIKDIPPMQRELSCLLVDLCVRWGFCIPPNDQKIISQAECYNAQDFAKDVIGAEGMKSEYELQWVRKISQKFRERFGDNEIDISTFKDRVRDEKENWHQ